MYIETPRLIIRNMKLNDLEDSYEHRGSASVSKFISEPLTFEQTKERLDQAVKPWQGNEHEKLGLAIELKSQGKLIGELMYKHTNIGSNIGEVGYRLNTNYQKKGYAYEAVSALITHLFEQLDLHKITAVCITKNNASWGLMERLGMKREALYRDHFKVVDKWFDGYSYALLVKEFELIMKRSDEKTA
ncbi:GNAT family N-acetyltransferase [Pseudoalteromonas denitrificans]|uniref:Protein N-acetyltransferase, RimJ/RimL family n=1 Tax=Pseudoalteromonas denitrificans DSM 6059 TaxID=1123010 RepID=A0A1I1RF06_9GAMM|nr:GNAT family protein [Pseudoalteromonas denitrificans]SFD32889.1 Protein N-acetyltransferase, RimJ/RimL family [Pseudoalteromonas denitrificans DSM 6059]